MARQVGALKYKGTLGDVRLVVEATWVSVLGLRIKIGYC